MPAGGLELTGAWTSAGSMVFKFRCVLDTRPTLVDIIIILNFAIILSRSFVKIRKNQFPADDYNNCCYIPEMGK